MSCFLLETASEIAAVLCREAFWSGDRCTWVGRAPEESSPGSPPTVRPLLGDLYGGNAGVGLFLAEFASITGDRRASETARAALQQASVQADRIRSQDRLGLYSGVVGIGLAMFRAGWRLQDDGLVTRGMLLVLETCAAATGDEPLDIIAGSGGAVQALLEIDSPAAVDLALKLAHSLVAAGIRDGDVLTWSPARATPGESSSKALTGFAHGASGMALALLEVAARTGRADLQEAGEAALRYETRLFSITHQNWPDLRVFEPTAYADNQHAFSVAWCHGAPGIGLARLRALELFPQTQQWRMDALAAMRTTGERMIALTLEPGCDATPCHGLAGLLEILRVAAQPLGDPGLVDMTRQAWKTMMSLCNGTSWSSGLPSRGRNPSLMLGLAGVGHTLLRAARADVVSSILLIPDRRTL